MLRISSFQPCGFTAIRYLQPFASHRLTFGCFRYQFRSTCTHHYPHIRASLLCLREKTYFLLFPIRFIICNHVKDLQMFPPGSRYRKPFNPTTGMFYKLMSICSYRQPSIAYPISWMLRFLPIGSLPTKEALYSSIFILASAQASLNACLKEYHRSDLFLLE